MKNARSCRAFSFLRAAFGPATLKATLARQPNTPYSACSTSPVAVLISSASSPTRTHS